jgi:hypothetical protein
VNSVFVLIVFSASNDPVIVTTLLDTSRITTLITEKSIAIASGTSSVVFCCISAKKNSYCVVYRKTTSPMRTALCLHALDPFPRKTMRGTSARINYIIV